MSKRLADVIAAERAARVPPAGAKERHWAAISAGLGGPDGDGPEGGEPGPASGGGTTLLGGGGSTPAAASPSFGVAAKATLVAVAAGLAGVVAVAAATGDRVRANPIEASDPVDVEAEHAAAAPRVDNPTETGGAARARDARRVNASAPDTIRDGLPAAEGERPPGTPSLGTDRPRERPPSPPRSSSPRAPALLENHDSPRGLRAELLLIDEAERALGQKRFDAVLQLMARHAETFPEGELAAERLDLESAAHCARGDLEGGRRKLAELRHIWPHSPISAITKKNCEGQTDRLDAGH